eukprot:4061070-Prorocentrum_lima.AAC.1
MVVNSWRARRLEGVGLAPAAFGIQTCRSRLGPRMWRSSSSSPAVAAWRACPTMAATMPDPQCRVS